MSCWLLFRLGSERSCSGMDLKGSLSLYLLKILSRLYINTEGLIMLLETNKQQTMLSFKAPLMCPMGGQEGFCVADRCLYAMTTE